MSIAAVSSLNSVPSSTAASTNATAGAITSAVSFDFTTYLQIITTQLQNQDPTNATDPNQYTQELIQIEQVQVQNNTNADLEGLTQASSTNSLATGASYIGNYVQANSTNDQFPLQGGGGEFGYTLPSAASSALVTIQDSNGNTVATLNGGTAAGGNYVAWNGEESDGSTAPDGTYTFTVDAADSAGNAMSSSNPVAMFYVTSVQSNTNGTLQLLAGTLSLSTSDVTNLYTASTLPTATTATLATT